ncbi:hypothetical protein AAFF_G00213270 [Aldrovandia affinis]|uniref:Uncharacterized protein n=1 Tax=Aldrovandia affinis TaxID=143900 RepID=A0AAD7RGW6_9TELE|nr:hypothetical protein AAFF_G00213270 [Aldrovandia affinis]
MAVSAGASGVRGQGSRPLRKWFALPILNGPSVPPPPGPATCLKCGRCGAVDTQYWKSMWDAVDSDDPVCTTVTAVDMILLNGPFPV